MNMLAPAAAMEKRRARGPAMDHDENSPAFKIIFGVFGSITAFSNETGIPLGTAHRFLTTGLIPARRQGDVVRAAREHKRELDPALFVPTA